MFLLLKLLLGCTFDVVGLADYMFYFSAVCIGRALHLAVSQFVGLVVVIITLCKVCLFSGTTCFKVNTQSNLSIHKVFHTKSIYFISQQARRML